MSKPNAQKKEAVILTAIDLFNQESFTSIGMDRIIAASGISKMTVYKYFSSKENLIFECLQFLHIELMQSLSRQLESEQSPSTQLEITYFWYMRLILDKSFKGDLFQKARTELLSQYPSIEPILNLHRDWFYQHIFALFKQFDLVSPQSITHLFIFILEGMMSDSAANKEIIDPQKTWNFIQTLIELEKTSNKANSTSL